MTTTYQPLPPSSRREMFDAIDRAEAAGTITPMHAADLRKRMDGASLTDVATGRGVSKQAIHKAQAKALNRLGAAPDALERLLDQEQAYQAERLRRRARLSQAYAMTKPQGLDQLVEDTGLDRAATVLLLAAGW